MPVVGWGRQRAVRGRSIPERVRGLEAGANDYISKPFSPRSSLSCRYSRLSLGGPDELECLVQVEGVAEVVALPLVTAQVPQLGQLL